MATAAGGTAPGADGTTPAGPSVPAGLAPAGISRSGLPRAGRTASGAGRSGVEAGPEGGGAGRSGAIDPVRSGAIDPVRSGPLRRSDAARWTVAGAAVEDAAEKGVGAGAGGATGVAGAAGASAVICRSGMAGRRATVSGGAIRSGRTATGRDGGRAAASALLPGPSVGRPGAGRAPARAAEPTEPDGPDEPAGSGEPDEAPEPTESDERDSPDEPVRSEELDEVADPAAEGVAGPDRAVFERPDASLDASPDRAESAGPAEPAVPDAAVRPVEAAERDTYTVPGVPADDDRFAGPEGPDEDWFPDDWPPGPGAPDDAPDLAPEAPADDRDVAPEARDDGRSAGSEAREDDRLVAPAPDDDRLAPGLADRWTGGDAGPGFPVPVPIPRADALPAEADGRSEAGPRGSAGSSASAGRTARSSSGPPGDAEGRAEPGRATPWMRPTGADGRTAWPSSPPRDGFCQEARRERNRSPSLTPIEDRATVIDGAATRRHPPSQPPSSAPPLPPPAPAGTAGTVGTSSRPPPPRASLSCDGVTDRRRPVRRSQSPNPTRSPAFVDAGVDPRYLPHPLLTFAVGEVENVLTLPMEVVGDVRDLLPQPGKRVRHDSPRRPPERSTSNEPWHSGQVTAAWVWPSLLMRR
ncbi:hypothetical protein K7395_09150 [Streptomyces filamentosus]|uniref:Uncharacterized protein n=1 Tax=Streptomyces filamentosus TaxID=67294 RepID=A0ABY4V9K6_STRFL|nr:hypothetical protein [Streptomyces filamentosus]USC51837.1 hypothetical protein K7395_09150 [Streptomyces filamentosus]